MSKTVPVMANQLPWNDLVLFGERTYKTLHFNWKYRGKILLYNSHKTDVDALFDYQVKNEELAAMSKGAIVGYATVAGVDGDDGYFEVELQDPKRFKRPIPFQMPRGAVRLTKAPAHYLRRKTV
jgi:hypothetical protein